MATKATILGKVARLVRTDTPAIIAGDIDPYVEAALVIYSRDKPYEFVEDVTGSAAKLQATPANWSAQWSAISRIVYPYEDEDSDVLESDAYIVDTVPVAGTPTDKIRFASHEPAATETVRVWYTRPHVCTEASCTIYAQDEQPFCFLCASIVETAKASYYNALKDQTLTADLVDYGAKAGEARALARMFEDLYRRGLGLPKGDAVVPAGVVGDLDVEPQYTPLVSPQAHHRAGHR